MADADRVEQRPIDSTGGYGRYTDSEDLYGELKESSDNGTEESGGFTEIGDNGFTETGWETPRQAKNKKRGLGQREDDHSGDYQNNNELYYGPSM